MSRTQPRAARLLLHLASLVAAMAAILFALSLGRAAHTRESLKNLLPTVVMVMSVDVVNGKLQPVSSGSGTILTADGSVLTNHHVVNNEKIGKLHDLFLIGRFRSADAEPEFVCAGRPGYGK